ncbi:MULTISPECIES: Flp family type IVb pilin [Phyllobacterium]|jgi:pilus assembly protein Flp/PilA|uniref:Flp family type IVb pilin n=1 Tax=Phyllobacterium sophorae TaxID=1520277 RepID=A0A2P7BCI6_9HYPH|nr:MULTISPECIES: Flp family type IVb pilin [Phyllobacterium]PSH64180.1 Flp family type IVb pilin [Phyllobacterium sophorae]UXN63019.1 Flp family type IVb pilin [Phyllobacterium sp. A18/5-2]
MKRTVNATLDAFARFLGNKCGATAIEYTLIASIISLSIILGAGMLGGSVRTFFDRIAEQVTQATNG